MKKSLVLMAVFAVGAFAESWTGVIADASCGLKHAAGAAADAACSKKCIEGGSAAVFVSGDKVYKIANQASIKGHEGHKVTIDGKMTGDTIQVDSVKM